MTLDQVREVQREAAWETARAQSAHDLAAAAVWEQLRRSAAGVVLLLELRQEVREGKAPVRNPA